MSWSRAIAKLVAAAAVCVLGCACAEPGERALTIFAAASLRDVFSAMGPEFQREHPGVELTFNFAGTQQLRTQIEQGAAVDVFAAADELHMQPLVRAASVVEPVIFARNQPVMVVALEQAAMLRSFADLPQAERIVIGAPEVPIGRYTEEIFARAGRTLGADFRARVTSRVVSQELNVRQVLTKVSVGEADAGVVYRTDAIAAAERVVMLPLPLPPELEVVAHYPIAVLNDAPHPELARAFIDFVLSSQGQQILVRAGFLPPNPP